MTRRLLVVGLLALLTLPAVTPRIYASDEVEYFAFLRSLTFDHDLSFENEYQHFADAGAGGAGFHDTFLGDRYTRAGRRLNFGTIGPALLWAPFYGAGHLAAGILGAPQDGYSQPYITAVALGSAVYGWLAILLAASIAERWFGRGLGAALAVLVGSPLLFYMYVAPPFSHACATFAVTACLWTWLRVRDTWSWGGVIWLGLTVGLMATMRDQAGLFAIGPALDFARSVLARLPRRSVGGGGLRPLALIVAGTAAAVVAYLPQLFASRAVNGYFGPHESVGNKMSWSSPHALSVLVDVHHGWLWWTPLALLSLVGLVAVASGRIRTKVGDGRWLAICMVVMVVVQIYINGAVESWTVAGSFGQRRFVELTPLLILGLAALTSASQSIARRLLWAVVALCVWWNLGLLLQFGTNRMDRQQLTLGDNARQTFVELPIEAPSLAWRYLTDRSSFYRQPRQ
ncbi:MAG TPA: hypothetical protein VMZ90_14515 [Vicinamibacterales bacterium]|nr:hypothetical protein [Vicinamibacterales bacterium]